MDSHEMSNDQKIPAIGRAFAWPQGHRSKKTVRLTSLLRSFAPSDQSRRQPRQKGILVHTYGCAVGPLLVQHKRG